MYRESERDYAGGGLGREHFGGFVREHRHDPWREDLRGRFTEIGEVEGYRRDLRYDRGYGSAPPPRYRGKAGYQRAAESPLYEPGYVPDYRRERSSAPGVIYGAFWNVPGPHAGVGPKGYRRTAEHIREDVSVRLTRHGLIDASDIEVRIEEDEVTLAGTVASRRMKRMADDVAHSVSGVHDVHNRLTVRREAQPAAQPQGNGTSVS